ncbi:hypothetical protein V5799_010923 [Amblyomma americanum]|uniref:Uncharacterized protein n=1 Tax=Amblyomma americanum TaxID=6943 RepID=A0AAQ4EIM4_AMBAM
MIKVAEKACIGVQLCYSYNAHKKTQSDITFRQAVRKCILTASRAFKAIKPEALAFTEEQFESMMQHFNVSKRNFFLPSFTHGVLVQREL